MRKHYRILIEVKDVKELISKEDIKNIASKYLNVDDEPRVFLKESIRIDTISLRVDYNNPVKGLNNNNICEAVSVIVDLLEELNIEWKAIEIYETTSYEEEGGIVVDTTSSTSRLAAVSSAVLGGFAGYLIGGKLEKLERIVCEYENEHGFPILVYKGLEKS